MKSSSCFILISLLFNISIFSFANSPEKSKPSIPNLIKERTERYIIYSSFQDEKMDSVKIISANQLLEIDNKIITKAISIDSLNTVSLEKIAAFEAQKKERKLKIKKIHIPAGAGMFLCLVIALVIYFWLKSKLKKANRKLEEISNGKEQLNRELLSVKNEKENLEKEWKEKSDKLNSDQILKDEIITNLESKFKDYQQKENAVNELLILKEKEFAEIKKNHAEQLEEANKRFNAIAINNNESDEEKKSLLKAKEDAEINLQSIIDDYKKETEIRESLIADSLKLVETNKELLEKIEVLEKESHLFEDDLEEIKEAKDKMLEEIYDLEDQVYELRSMHKEHGISALKEMFETNIETLKLANMKLSAEKDQLERNLRMREPEEVLATKINVIAQENFNLQLDLEDEKAYVEKLHEKLDKYLDELEKQDLELELLNLKIKDRVMPESRQKFDDMELNLVKIEKLNRLKEMMAISEDEYQLMKKNIINQI